MISKTGFQNKYCITPFFRSHIYIIIIFVTGIGMILTSCQQKTVIPTIAAVAATVETVTEIPELIIEPTLAFIPPTWTPQSQSDTPNIVSTMTQVPTSTPRATKTALPTLLPTLTLTSSPTPVVTAAPATDTHHWRD